MAAITCVPIRPITRDKVIIPYKDIPGFPQSHVAGHAGNLVIGRIGAQVIAAMQGRFHYYEGFPPILSCCTFPSAFI